MQLYPAIDMLDGNAVRLRQGRRDDVTIFGNPVDLAAKWREQGATYLHLVDLTAAFDGQTKHLPLIRKVIRAFGGNVELGGGLRTMADIALRIEAGVTRCIIGTAAIEHPELVKEACRAFPGQIAVGLDVREGYIATSGWTETSSLPYLEFAQQAQSLGCRTMIATDISRDGTLCGPGIQMLRALQKAVPGVMLIASGGIRDLTDILALKDLGIYGAICGKSLYAGTLDLQEALEAAGQQNA